mmetsp:Transcript_16576/g.47583  ORF Transcript_16576/g.47583 Transcript_16576/m.47583 type:complete len:146 (+) Transcript_16576:2184-2621(+)
MADNESAIATTAPELLEPTYRTKPRDDERFNAVTAKSIAAEILERELDSAKVDAGKQVEDWADFSDGFESLSKSIADKVKEKCREELHCPRYKILVHLAIGQRKDQGVSVISRCLWDTGTDNYATVSYRNETIWASCIVFGLYTE